MVVHAKTCDYHTIVEAKPSTVLVMFLHFARVLIYFTSHYQFATDFGEGTLSVWRDCERNINQLIN
jgi:hypothetical protein